MRVGNIECHTKKPERWLSQPNPNVDPGSNVPSSLDRMQGPDHYRTSPVSITSSVQWEHYT